MAPVKGLALPSFPSIEEYLRCESTTSAAARVLSARAAADSTMTHRIS
jgi:hypothetical protein